MIPERKWGQSFDLSKLTIITKFIIEKHQLAVASFLGFNSGYHLRIIGTSNKVKKTLLNYLLFKIYRNIK